MTCSCIKPYKASLIIFFEQKIYGKIKHKLRVTSSDVRFTSSKELRVRIHKLRVQTTSYEFNSTSYEFQFTSYEFKSTNYEFKSMSYEFKPTSYEFNPRFTSSDPGVWRLKARVGWLTVSWRRPLSYRNQSIDFLLKSIDWFLYDNSFRHEKVKSPSRKIKRTTKEMKSTC